MREVGGGAVRLAGGSEQRTSIGPGSGLVALGFDDESEMRLGFTEPPELDQPGGEGLVVLCVPGLQRRAIS